MTQYTAQVMDADAFLEHYGVKGMKWGHRKAVGTDVAGGFGTRTKRRLKVDAQHIKANASVAKANVTVGKKRAAAKDSAREKKLDYLNNPDRVTAATLTKGEKIALALFTSPVGAVAGIKTANAKANRIEYMQKTGGYNKQRAKK